ncbi:MAG: AMP-binding protein, partial [Rhodovibrionaceae bacterium]|nr:AMP-binding protein [Rhodovibrionaceae bacterium]
MRPTPTDQTKIELRRGTFETLTQALDYAAKAPTGFNFYSSRGELLRVLSYAELRERALKLARGLMRAGMTPGSRLLLLADTDADFGIVFMACQYASVLPVPVALPTSFGEKDSYARTVRRQLEDSGARAAMAPAELIDTLRSAAEGLDLALLGTPQDFYDLPTSGAEPRPFGKDELCYIQYSSGSTRFPRGIEITQEALTSNCRDIAESGLQVSQADRCVSWLPLYHDMGLVGFMLTPLCTQLSVDYLTTRDFARRPMTWLKLVSENKGTLSYSPSFGYDICVRRLRGGANAELDLSSWRVAGIGGDMIQPKILDLFCERFEPHGFRREALVPSYGMAETTLAVTFASLGEGLVIDPVDRQALAEAEKAQPAPNGGGR